MGYSLEGHPRSRTLTWLGVIALAGLISMAMLLLGGTDAAAKESYHDPNVNDMGYCSGCHPGFADGRKGALHRLHTNGTSELGVITRNCSLCHTGSGRDNPMTMWSIGDDGDGLGCAGCHGRDYGETIHEDYRGFPIAGLPKASAHGLRDYHFTSEGIRCSRCHTGAPQGTLGEDVAPPYYSRSDVNVNDPCADLLDNDGDGWYDADDPDCSGNIPPVADPNGPYEGTVGVPVEFDGSASHDSDGSIVDYDWDFGDGHSATGATPSHTYEAIGVKTVTLTVTDDGGLTDTSTTTVTITSDSNDPPVADAGGPYVGAVGEPVEFDGSASYDLDGSIVAYDWDFGDGNSATGASPSHTYATTGVKTVTLTVTDDGGLTDTATTTATITELPNTPPVAADESYTATEGVLLTVAAPGVLGNDSDADGDPLQAVLNSDVSNGALTLEPDGSFVYESDPDFVGSDSFTYVADDGIEHSNVATVTITVNLAGVVLANDDSYATFADATLTVGAPGVLANDVGGAGRLAFKRTDPANGWLELDYDGSFTYTPAPGFVGSDSFTYDFWDTDNLRYSNLATVTIEVVLVDLDIARFRATKKADLSRFRGITLTLDVANNGTIDSPDSATATIVGNQGSAEVYRTTFPVSSLPGDTTIFVIDINDPGPFSPGTVEWTVELDVPDDPDLDDEATATTTITD